MSCFEGLMNLGKARDQKDLGTKAWLTGPGQYWQQMQILCCSSYSSSKQDRAGGCPLSLVTLFDQASHQLQAKQDSQGRKANRLVRAGYQRLSSTQLTAAASGLSTHLPRERNCVCAVINLLQLACSDYLSTQVRRFLFIFFPLLTK